MKKVLYGFCILSLILVFPGCSSKRQVGNVQEIQVSLEAKKERMCYVFDTRAYNSTFNNDIVLGAALLSTYEATKELNDEKLQSLAKAMVEHFDKRELWELSGVMIQFAKECGLEKNS